ncbi:MAG: transporter substrate-binding domain-containing protein [Pseudomonadota bacterium]
MKTGSHSHRYIAAALVGLGPFLPAAAQETGDAAPAPDQIAFGYRTDAPPFSGLQGGRLNGYSVDLCVEVVEHLVDVYDTDRVDADLVEATAGTRFDLLTSGEIDILCGATSVTLERRYFMGFSIPIFIDGVAFAVAGSAGPDIAALTAQSLPIADLATSDALAGQTIGVLENTTTETFLDEAILAQTTDIQIDVFDTHLAAIEALSSGAIAAYFASHGILRGLGAGGAPIVVSPTALTYEPIALGLSRDDPDLALLVDEALSQLYLSGDIIPIYERHFGPMSGETRLFFARTALR